MEYGYFDNQRNEYVITNPRTPVKWINYIGTLDFGGFVDHTGGMLICKQDPALNRITKYIPQLPASDFKGSTVYIRIKGEAGYDLYSPFLTPVLKALDRFECRVGLGYSTFIAEYKAVRSEITFFAPGDNSCILMDMKITNLGGTGLSIDLIPVVEYSHPLGMKQFNNADWVPQTMQSRVLDNEEGALVVGQYAFIYREEKVNYFATNTPCSFQTDRARFLGDHEYGSWAAPGELNNEELDNYEAHRGDNICALMHRLGELAPGESRRVICQLGQTASIEEARPFIRKYREEKEVDRAFEELSSFFAGFLSTLQVETPDPAMNSMLNIFNPYQCFVTLNWSRFLSLYQLGLGARGIGFRDSSQDVLGCMDRVPGKALALIRRLLLVQNPDGSAMHQFYPLTMEANRGDSAEKPDRPKYYGDDHLWIILSIAAYLKETGDMDFLKEEISYYREKASLPGEKGTVFDHMCRAVEFTRSHRGAHGLPFLGFADWNDSVNLPSGAESMMVANLYGAALHEMILLCQHLGDQEEGDRFRKYYGEMKAAFCEHAWDGEWYLRYFDENGEPLGSHENDKGQIYANAQSWPVISGFASEDKARQALDSVYRQLNTSRGIKVSAPGYDGYDSRKGGITTYPPGAKENGGIFLHTNPWVMIAETLLGNGDRGYEYYSQVNPAAKNGIIDEFECEPYVYPQNILGDEHPQFGLGRNSWLSGTASWIYQAATQFILGIKPFYTGLMLEPCIPRSWKGFKAVRQYKGAVYSITVENPSGVSRGIKSLTVDGEIIEGNIIPAFKDGKTHMIKLIMG